MSCLTATAWCREVFGEEREALLNAIAAEEQRQARASNAPAPAAPGESTAGAAPGTSIAAGSVIAPGSAAGGEDDSLDAFMGTMRSQMDVDKLAEMRTQLAELDAQLARWVWAQGWLSRCGDAVGTVVWTACCVRARHVMRLHVAGMCAPWCASAWACELVWAARLPVPLPAQVWGHAVLNMSDTVSHERDARADVWIPHNAATCSAWTHPQKLPATSAADTSRPQRHASQGTNMLEHACW
eukprot:236148-Chlamydomonas_euryale.AAC.2